MTGHMDQSQSPSALLTVRGRLEDMDLLPVTMPGSTSSPSPSSNVGGFPQEELFYNCLLCVDTFKSPVQLECNHAFCDQCLRSYIESHEAIQSNNEGRFVTCPTCRKETKELPGGFKRLDLDTDEGKHIMPRRKMSAINAGTAQCDVCIFKSKTEDAEVYCSKCSLNMCSECNTVHGQQDLFRTHTVIHISNKETFNIHCEIHNKLESYFFCLSCLAPCCTVCVLHDHCSHHTVKLWDALNMRRENIKTQLNSIGPTLDKIDTKLKRMIYICAMKSNTKMSPIIRSVSDHQDNITDSRKLMPQDRRLDQTSHKHMSSPLGDRPKLSAAEKRTDAHKKERKFSMFERGKEKKPSPKNNTSHRVEMRKMSLWDNFMSKGASPSPPTHSPIVERKRASLDMKVTDLPRNNQHISPSSETEPFVVWERRDASHTAKPRSPTSPTFPISPRRSLGSPTTHFADSTKKSPTSPTLRNKSPSKGSMSSPKLRIKDPSKTPIFGSPKKDKKRINGSSLPRNELSPSKELAKHLLPSDQRENLAVIEVKIQGYLCQVETLRKLYDLAAKMLEMSQSRRFLAAYDEILCRLLSVSQVEIVHLQEGMETMTREASFMNDLLQQISANSNYSVNGSSKDHGSSVSSTDGDSSIENISAFDHPQSLLIKPKLLWKMEKQKNDAGDLWNPCDIGFLPDNRVIVAEYDTLSYKNNRLHLFDEKGNSLETIGDDQVRPLGLAVTSDGHIAVTDCRDKRVKVFTSSGQIVNEWGKGQFGWPYGIAVNSKGQLIVSDAFNDTVSIHQPDGRRIKQFGSSGHGNQQFRNPYHVAVDHKDNIIVSDCGNNCIKVFDVNGEFLFRNGDSGVPVMNQYGVEKKRLRHRLKGPRGVAVDLKGNILVADDNSRVCMFSSQGRYVRNVLTEEDSVKYPEGLATNNSGILAVTEWNPSNMFAIKIFRLYE